MNFDQLPPVELLLFVVPLVTLTLVAAIFDFRERRIPNALTVSGFLLGVIYQTSTHGLPGLRESLLGFAVGFGSLFLMWVIGGGGGGDVKLMGAVGAWLGVTYTVIVLLFSTVLVAVWSGLFLMTRLVTGKLQFQANLQTDPASPSHVDPTGKKNRRVVAFALPVALATWVVVFCFAAKIVAGSSIG